MPFLKRLVSEVARRAAQDPRVRDTAKKVFENEIKPRAKTAWEKARPEVEAAWEKAKPELETAKRKALDKAADIRDRVSRGVDEFNAPRSDRPDERGDTK